MKQRLKSRPTRLEAPAALSCPACELCTEPTRFVGLESLPNSDQGDLCTYECSQCGHMQASVVARIPVQDGEVLDPRH
jgi:hypothetical protein